MAVNAIILQGLSAQEEFLLWRLAHRRSRASVAQEHQVTARTVHGWEVALEPPDECRMSPESATDLQLVKFLLAKHGVKATRMAELLGLEAGPRGQRLISDMVSGQTDPARLVQYWAQRVQEGAPPRPAADPAPDEQAWDDALPPIDTAAADASAAESHSPSDAYVLNI